MNIKEITPIILGGLGAAIAAFTILNKDINDVKFTAAISMATASITGACGLARNDSDK